MINMSSFLSATAAKTDKALNKHKFNQVLSTTWSRGYKTFFMLNSVEHEIFPAHQC